MWVFEEIVEGQKLSELINSRHENVKYLPGVKIPDNVVRGTSLFILLFCLMTKSIFMATCTDAECNFAMKI